MSFIDMFAAEQLQERGLAEYQVREVFKEDDHVIALLEDEDMGLEFEVDLGEATTGLEHDNDHFCYWG